MILTTNFLIFAFLCAIAVKSLVDLSFTSVRSILSKKMGHYLPDNGDTVPNLKLKPIHLFVYLAIDLIELVAIGYILFSTNFFIPVVLFSIVMANFLISWLAILCPMGYIFKKQTTRIMWVYFSLNFGFFKNVVCILAFLTYLISV